MRAAPVAQTTALHQLYRQYHPWLDAWLQRRMGNREGAADLAQDTFMKVLLSNQAAQIAEPRAFLATVARRLLCNHYRRQDLERAYLASLEALPDEAVPSEEVRMLALETLLELDRRLAELPGRARQVFVMAQLEGQRHNAIATQLGVSLASVKRDFAKAAYACYFAA